MSKKFPDIFEYFDYQRYLRDYYDCRHIIQPWYSYRFIKEKTGVDPGYMVKVYSGRKHIAPGKVDKFVSMLGLNKREAEYFRLMVLFAKAKTSDESNRYFELLVSFNGIKKQTLKAASYEYYTKWYHAAVREALVIYPFTGDYRELASIIIPEITPRQAQQSVALLERLGIIIKQDDNSYQPASKFITTGDKWKSVAIRKFQKDTIDLAGRALNNVPKEKRDISTITVSLSAEGFDSMRGRIEQFRKDMLELASNDHGVNGAYHINIQMFPLVKTRQEGES